MSTINTFFTLLVLVSWSIAGTSAQAAVVLGDIAIIGFRSDAPDAFSFVAINPIASGESISFWDSGYIGGGDGTGQGAGGGQWRGTENAFLWTNDTGADVAAGTVIVVTEDAADLGGSSGNLAGLSADGDQIFAGQGAAPDANPTIFDGTLLFGIDFNGNDGWNSTTDSSNDSALPSVLANNNITFAEIDNGQYTGPRQVTSLNQIAALVADTNNWTVANPSSEITLDSTDFVVVAVPEPSSVMLMCVIGLVVAYRQRFRRSLRLQA